MKQQLTSFVWLALFAIICLIQYGETSRYYLFTKSWAQTTCKMGDKSQNPNYKKTCKAHLPTEITIHGMWPQTIGSTVQLGYCPENTDKFNADHLKPIHSQLVHQWPTAFTGPGQSDETFWQHEWEKHGTCSPFSMFNYFHETLQLDLKYPINTWLKDGGVVPSNNRVYTVGLIEAIFKRHNVHANQYVLKCASIKGGKQLLSDVILCVSYADAKTLVQCSMVKTTCKNNFYFIANFMEKIG